MKKTNWLVYFKALFAVVVWGGSFIATKIAVAQISPTSVVWLRFAIGLPFLLAAVALRRQFEFPRFKDLGYFAALGFLGIAFHQWLQSNGLKTSQATTTAWIVSTSPAFIALLGWLILKEALNGLQAIGIVLSMTGVLLIVSKGDFANLAQGFGEPGDALILISAVNWAFFSILSRKGLCARSSALQTFWVTLIGWLVISLTFAAERGYTQIPRLDARGWAAMAFLGLFTSAFAYIAWFDALAQLPAAQSGAFLFIEPLAAAVIAAFLLDEKITLVSLLGGAVILFGVWLVNWNKDRKRNDEV